MKSIFRVLIAAVASILLVSCGPVLSEKVASQVESGPDTLRVSRLSILHEGTASGEEKSIERLIRSRIGTVYSRERVDRLTKDLYESGWVEDMRISKVRHGEGVVVTVVVRARLSSSPVLFRGNTAFSDARLGRVSGLKSLRPDREKIESARRAIEAFYRQHGYDRVKVMVIRMRETTSAPGFYFKITEGKVF